MKMKLLLTMVTLTVLTLVSVRAYPPAPASQDQVNAGLESYRYVTPLTLAAALTNCVSVRTTNGFYVASVSYPVIDDQVRMRCTSISNFNGSFSVDVLANARMASVATGTNPPVYMHITNGICTWTTNP